MMKRGYTIEEAERVATEIGIQWSNVLFNVEQFRKGLDVELEHGKRMPETNVTNDDPVITGKIALAHLLERADYYELLELVESGAIQLDQGPEMTTRELSDAVESYDRTVSFAATNPKKDEGRAMSEHPNFIKVAGHLYQLEPEEAPTSIRVHGFMYDRVDEPEAPTFIKVKGMLFRRDDNLVEGAKKGKKKDKKDDKKGGKKPAAKKKAPKKPSKKDDKKDDVKATWSKLPKGWTKKSSKSFWNSIDGSMTECKRKLKDADEIDKAGAFCTRLKGLMDEDGWKKSPKGKKSKKASMGAPTYVTYKGVRFELDE